MPNFHLAFPGSEERLLHKATLSRCALTALLRGRAVLLVGVAVLDRWQTPRRRPKCRRSGRRSRSDAEARLPCRRAARRTARATLVVVTPWRHIGACGTSRKCGFFLPVAGAEALECPFSRLAVASRPRPSVLDHALCRWSTARRLEARGPAAALCSYRPGRATAAAGGCFYGWGPDAEARGVALGVAGRQHGCFVSGVRCGGWLASSRTRATPAAA